MAEARSRAARPSATRSTGASGSKETNGRILAADALSGVPTADDTMTPAELAATVEALVRVYGDTTDRLGFRVEVDELTEAIALYLN